MSLTGRSNGDIIKALYDHKRHVEKLLRRIEDLEVEVREMKAAIRNPQFRSDD